MSMLVSLLSASINPHEMLLAEIALTLAPLCGDLNLGRLICLIFCAVWRLFKPTYLVYGVMHVICILRFCPFFLDCWIDCFGVVHPLLPLFFTKGIFVLGCYERLAWECCCADAELKHLDGLSLFLSSSSCCSSQLSLLDLQLVIW